MRNSAFAKKKTPVLRSRDSQAPRITVEPVFTTQQTTNNLSQVSKTNSLHHKLNSDILDKSKGTSGADHVFMKKAAQ